MTMTHKEAILHAHNVSFDEMPSMAFFASQTEWHAQRNTRLVKEYLEARGLVAVPERDPSDDALAGAIKVYESFGKKMNGMCNARRFFLRAAAAPDPFEDGE